MPNLHCTVPAVLAASILGGFILSSSTAQAFDQLVASADNRQWNSLADLSLERLMDIEVFSVSKSAQPWRKAAAATYVLTGDDLRRAGVASVPEALKLIPGLTVAQIDAHTWAVTARGFNSTLADKLEVLLDGRSLYTPLFSGVYWQKHNLLMADIERIEVIRGPGAALWGANAVNGVINIVTRSADSTQKELLEAGVSNKGEQHLGARAGLKVPNGALRLYAKQEAVDSFHLRSGADAEDSFEAWRIGFRSDLEFGQDLKVALFGETYRDEIDMPMRHTKEEQGTDYLMAAVSKQRYGKALYEFRAHFERNDFTIPGLFHEKRDTFSSELRRYFHPTDNQELVVGLGYQLTQDEIDSPNLNSLAFLPSEASDETYGLYVQDMIELLKGKLRLTLGVKIEDTDYTGLEIQPSVRLSYTPRPTTTLWSAVSRAVRIPTRLDEDFVIYAPEPAPPGLVVIRGSENFEAEELLAYEVGFREIVSDSVSLDVALFYNDYDQLRGLDENVFPARISNEGEGHSSGVEIVVNWLPDEKLSLQLGYSYHDIDYKAKSGSSDTSIARSNRNDPRHQGFLRATWTLNRAWNMDVRLRNVSELPDPDIDGYTELDATLNWQVAPDLTLSLLGSNLLDGQHPEFGTSRHTVEVPRSIKLNASWGF